MLIKVTEYALAAPPQPHQSAVQSLDSSSSIKHLLFFLIHGEGSTGTAGCASAGYRTSLRRLPRVTAPVAEARPTTALVPRGRAALCAVVRRGRRGGAPRRPRPRPRQLQEVESAVQALVALVAPDRLIRQVQI